MDDREKIAATGSCRHGVPRPTELAHWLLDSYILPADLVVDATAGNGHDTLFLAERAGRVLAFDVQAEAVESARSRVEAEGLGGKVRFFVESHANLCRHAASGSVAAVMFNLGYLPGGDHGRTTVPEETLRALEAAAAVLRPGGALSIVVYPAHPGGADEAAAVEEWITRRTADGWRVARYGAVGTLRPAPFLLLAVKGQGGRPRL